MRALRVLKATRPFSHGKRWINEFLVRARTHATTAASSKYKIVTNELADGVRVSVLPSGLRVASVPDPHAAFASLGLYVRAGSCDEQANERSVSQLVPHLALRAQNPQCMQFASDNVSSQLKSTDLGALVAELGGNVGAMATRECLVMQGSVLHDRVDAGVRLLALALLRRGYTESRDLPSARDSVKFAIEEVSKTPAAYARDYLYSTAYPRSSIGYNAYAEGVKDIANVSESAVNAFCQRLLRPDRAVLVGVGVRGGHDELVDLAQRYIGSALPNTSDVSLQPERPEYVGGVSVRQIDAPPRTHPNEVRAQTYVQLAFPAPSGCDVREGMAAHVLQFLLGGGDAFSSGGPGKGMYTRLYTRVLNRLHFMESCSAFYEAHTHGGLFGIAAACQPEYNARMVQILCQQLADLRLGAVPPNAEELSRAKNQLRAYMFMSLESQLLRAENVGLQLLLRGSYVDPSDAAKTIAELTAEEIMQEASKMFDQPGSCVVIGENLRGIRDLDAVKATMQSVAASPRARHLFSPQ